MNACPISAIVLSACPIAAIFFLVLIVVVVKIAVGLLRYGVIRWVLFGFMLLVVLSAMALVASISQGVRYVNSGGTVHIQQRGDTVKVSPFGVDVRSRSGESVKVGPMGVEVYTQAAGGPADSYPDSAQSRQRNTAQEGLQQIEAYIRSRNAANRSSPSGAATRPASGNPSVAAPRGDSTPAEPSPLPAEAPEQPVTHAPPSGPQPLLADHFDPDVYQSEGAAVRGLTSQMAKLLDTVTAGKKGPSRIVIKGSIDQPLPREMWNVLSKDFPFANVSCSESTWSVSQDTVLLYACHEPQENAQASTSPDNIAGSPQVLRIDAAGSEGKISRSARFLDKPWVDDFATFASRSNARTWVMALSRSPAVSAGEAEQKAIDDAVSQLIPRVRDKLSTDAREAMDWLLQRQIRANLESSGMIADRCVQRFERPYGELWQVGLLIDASARKIAGLAEKCDRLLAVQQRTHRQTALSVAGIVAFVCVVYIFLNSVTKGYFVWSLRAAAIAIIAGGVFLVLLLSHNEPAIEGFMR